MDLTVVLIIISVFALLVIITIYLKLKNINNKESDITTNYIYKTTLDHMSMFVTLIAQLTRTYYETEKSKSRTSENMLNLIKKVYDNVINSIEIDKYAEMFGMTDSGIRNWVAYLIKESIEELHSEEK